MIRNSFLITLSFLLAFTTSNAQLPPSIQISTVMGGSKQDNGRLIIQTRDRGYLIAGDVLSNDGYVKGNTDQQYGDIWLVKLDSAGAIVWSVLMEGEGIDIPRALAETPDEYLIGGYSHSKTGVYAPLATSTVKQQGFIAWVDKATGSIHVLKQYTGDNLGSINQIKVVEDKYLAVTGSYSYAKNSAGVYAARDLYVAKMKINGDIIWEHAYGGKNDDWGWCILPKSKAHNVRDRGYLVGGYTFSNDYDVKGAKGGGDAWVLNLDSVGNIIWSKCYGGTGWEWITGIGEGPFNSESGATLDEEFILTGSTSSNDHDFYNMNKGAEDYWAMKIDGNGTILWRNTYGGSGTDWSNTGAGVRFTKDYGAVIYGYTTSKDGDAAGRTTTLADELLVRIDKDGNKVWSKYLGSSLYDGNTGDVTITCDDGYAITELVPNVSQDVKGNDRGGGEIWFCKMGSDGLDNIDCPPYQQAVSINNIAPVAKLSVYPNPASTEIIISSNSSEEATVVLYDMTGRAVAKYNVKNIRDARVDVSAMTAGVYVLNITTATGVRLTERISIM